MTTIEELAARLQALMDRQAIADVIVTIARGIDRYDQILLGRLIDPAASLDMGGDVPMTGADFVAALKPPATPRPGRMHVVSNQSIEVSGDEARAESYITSCMDMLKDGTPHSRIRAGRYLDRFVRRGDGWVLVSRMMVDEWGRVDPIALDATPGRNRGAPAPGDASYAPGARLERW